MKLVREKGTSRYYNVNHFSCFNFEDSHENGTIAIVAYDVSNNKVTIENFGICHNHPTWSNLYNHALDEYHKFLRFLSDNHSNIYSEYRKPLKQAEGE